MVQPDENQFAYSNNRSTEDAINLLQYYISCGFNVCPNTSKVAMVSFDVRKAFDQVQKNRLLLILRRDFHLPDGLCSLIDSYLSARKQTVVIKDSYSEPSNVVSGVPQGSILGPHLFNAYVKSIVNLQLSTDTRLISFADDLVVLKPIVSDHSLVELQEDINHLLREYEQLKLSLNPTKSSYMVCSLAPHVADAFGTPIEINGVQLQHKSELKYLGVTIDQKLSFGPNAEILAAKGKKAIGALWRMFGRWATRDHFGKFYQ